MVYKMRGKWPYICCFWGCCFQDLFKTVYAASLCSYYLAFSPDTLLKSRWCSHKIVLTATAWKNFHFILSERLDLQMVDNLFIVVYAFPKNMLISLSKDEILQLRYMKWYFNFRGLIFNIEMAPSYLKHMNFILSTYFFDIFTGVLLGDILVTYLFIICLHYLRISIDQNKENSLILKR